MFRWVLVASMNILLFQIEAAGKKKLCADAVRQLIESHKPDSVLVKMRMREAIKDAFGDDRFQPSEAFMAKVYDYFGAHTEILKLTREQQINQLGELLRDKTSLLTQDEMTIMKAYLLEKNMRQFNHLNGFERYGLAYISAMKKLMSPENYSPLFLMGADKILSDRELQLLNYKWNVGLADTDIAKVLPRGDGQEGEMHRNQVGVAYKKAMRRIRTAFGPLYVQEAYRTYSP